MTHDTSRDTTAPPSESDPEAAASDVDPDHWQRPASATAPGDFTVDVSNTQSHLDIDPRALGDLVRRALESEGVRRASISLAVVDDATIRTINRRHLRHDWPTDVISFLLSDPDDGELSGELVVSAEMAATTAREAGVPARDELALYLVHGLLHLCGHDDSTPEARRVMRRREGEILTSLGLTNTFPAAGPVGEDASPEPGCDAGTPARPGAGNGMREAAPWSI